MFEISFKLSAYLESPALLKSAYIWKILQCAPGIKWAPTNPHSAFFSPPPPLFSAAAPHAAPLQPSHQSLPFKILIWRVIRGGAPIPSAQTTAGSTMIFLCRFDAGKRVGRGGKPDYRKWHFKCEDNPPTRPAPPPFPPRRCTDSHLHVWADHRRTQLPRCLCQQYWLNSITVNPHLLPHCACHKTTAACSWAPREVAERAAVSKHPEGGGARRFTVYLPFWKCCNPFWMAFLCLICPPCYFAQSCLLNTSYYLTSHCRRAGNHEVLFSPLSETCMQDNDCSLPEFQVFDSEMYIHYTYTHTHWRRQWSSCECLHHQVFGACLTVWGGVNIYTVS